MHILGEFEGATISMEWREGRQVIVLSVPREVMESAAAHTIHGLAAALGQYSVSVEPGGTQIVIPHTRDVDRRLMTLIDLFADFRYSHPTLVQLPLALTQDEERELKEILGW